MPTKENVAALESLIEAVTAMAETKRHLDKVEYDIEVAKKQLQTRAEGGDEGDGDGMDVDETAGTETDGNEGRGQSIASARSMGGRNGSRKKVRPSRLGGFGRPTLTLIWMDRVRGQCRYHQLIRAYQQGSNVRRGVRFQEPWLVA